MSLDSPLVKVYNRKVCARVKGVMLPVAEKDGIQLLKPHTFELRKDGLWWHMKHSSKWGHVGFEGLVDETKRQTEEAKAVADAKREDPRQLVMFVAAPQENQKA